MKQRMDHFLVGFFSGMILPFLGFWLVYLYVSSERNLTWDTFWTMFKTGTDHRAAVLTLSLIANMLAFWLFFFQLKLNRASRGLVFITMVYGAYIVYLKL